MRTTNSLFLSLLAVAIAFVLGFPSAGLCEPGRSTNTSANTPANTPESCPSDGPPDGPLEGVKRPEILDSKEIIRLEPQGHACAITFDDGPGKNTARLLDILKSRGISATFFVLGQHVEKLPELVQRMAREGHEVDNHSYDHPLLRRLSAAQQQLEIERTETLLRDLGITPKFFRPPYGSYNADTVRNATRDNLVLVLWSVDSLDWKYHNLRGIEGQVLPRAAGQARGVFLFHDIHRTTVDAMPEVLDRLAKDGCRFVTLSQWVAEENPTPLGQDR